MKACVVPESHGPWLRLRPPSALGGGAQKHAAHRIESIGPVGFLSHVDSQIGIVSVGERCVLGSHGGTLSLGWPSDSPPLGNHITRPWRSLRSAGSYQPERRRPTLGGNTPRAFVRGRGKRPSEGGRPATQRAIAILDQKLAERLSSRSCQAPSYGFGLITTVMGLLRMSRRKQAWHGKRQEPSRGIAVTRYNSASQKSL